MANEKEKKFLSYRNAYKSDHLASSDIEEMIENSGKAILTLSKVEQLTNHTVAGRTMDIVNIASFKEDVKPLVINATNGAILEGFIGNKNILTWVNLNLKIELYVDESVKMKGVKVGGIRIKKIRPKDTKKELPTITNERLSAAIAQVNAGKYNKETLLKQFSFTADQKTILNGI